MINSQSEQLKKRAMKIHEIVNSDKEEFAACKNDLMTKVAMDSDSAEDVAESIREMFLPKLLEKEGLEIDDLPAHFKSEMTDEDEDFADETPDEDHDEEYDDYSDSDEYDEDHEEDDEDEADDEFDDSDDDSEVDDEIATIHISVPADKLREVESALEKVLGDTAKSKDQATVHKDKATGEKDMDKKELEARKAFRKTILAAMQDDDETQSVSRSDKFDHAKSEQYREEDYYTTKSMGMTDPDFDTLDYAEAKIPNFTDLINHVGKDLGLTESLTPTKYDGAPEDTDEYKLEFNPFEIPSQGNEDLYNEAVIPSEGKIPLKRTVNSSVLGEFDAEAAEEVLADALRSAGVEDDDLGKLTYAEALELYRAIRTASDDRKHYSPKGVLDFPQNHPTDPDHEAGSKKENRKAVTENMVEDAHTNGDKPDVRKKLYSSSMEQEAAGDEVDAYAAMLKKMMRGDDKDHHAKHDMKDEEREAGDFKMKMQPAPGTSVDMPLKTSSADTELFKARMKTAFGCASKLALAGILPSEDVDAYAEGMLADNLSVNAMIRQTKMQLANAAAIEERYAASNKGTRIASAGITFNPSVRAASVDLSGSQDIQNALRGLNWTTVRDVNGMEE
jgi:hypothetical protein